MPAPATEPCWCRDRFVADQDQYLRVCYRDGRKEHIRGPCFKFRDPILHTSITTLDAICLDAFEAVVVYQETCRSPDGAALAPAGAQLPTVLPAHGLSLCSLRRLLHSDCAPTMSSLALPSLHICSDNT